MKHFGFISRSWQRIKAVRLRNKVLIATATLLTVAVAIPVATYAYYAQEITNPELLMNRNNTGLVIVDRHGEVIYQYGKVNSHEDVELSEVSDVLERAVIASEDKNFYDHQGFSVTGIARAFYNNLATQSATGYGGSTISQQLVKNTLLSSDKNYLRKYQEVSMAVAVERHYSKEDILEMYLNSVYYGEGAFGISAAANTYFDTTPSELTLAQSSMLIGLLPAPSTYSPISGDAELAKQQQDQVLTRMVEVGYIDEQTKQEALSQELEYNQKTTEDRRYAPHYTNMVLDELRGRYDEETITRSGFTVETSLDLQWQRQAEQYVQEHIATIRDRGARNAGLVAIDPENGQIRALVGSADWENEDFGKVNVALRPRQPGSSFKPIYYTEALDQEIITPATILEDEPVTFGDYEPQNYDRRFRGDVSVRDALGQSLNIPAIEVMQELGVDNAVDTAQRLGIRTIEDSNNYGLALALGTAEARLLDMTNAYAAFANSGNQYNPTTITRIENKYQETVYTYQPEAREVMDEDATFLISDILSDDQARAPTFGGSLSIPNREVAVKTGTTDDNRDAWTIGYTPQVVVGVWVGNNENEPMQNIFGSSGAGPIWKNSITTFLEDSPPAHFSRPSNVTMVRICASNGLRAERPIEGTYEEFFIEGTAPTRTCDTTPEPEDEPAKPEEDEDQEGNGNNGGNAGNGNGNNGEENEPGNNSDNSGNSGSDSDTGNNDDDSDDSSSDSDTGSDDSDDNSSGDQSDSEDDSQDSGSQDGSGSSDDTTGSADDGTEENTSTSDSN